MRAEARNACHHGQTPGHGTVEDPPWARDWHGSGGLVGASPAPAPLPGTAGPPLGHGARCRPRYRRAQPCITATAPDPARAGRPWRPDGSGVSTVPGSDHDHRRRHSRDHSRSYLRRIRSVRVTSCCHRPGAGRWLLGHRPETHPSATGRTIRGCALVDRPRDDRYVDHAQRASHRPPAHPSRRRYRRRSRPPFPLTFGPAHATARA